MYNDVLEFAKRINNGRTVQDVFLHLTSEVGELSDEIAVKYGIIDGEPGKDGIFGEAVDIIAAALDLIYVDNPDITEEDVLEYLHTKLQKWESKACQGQ